jgi:hypothetical protein
LSVSHADLASALHCTPTVRNAKRAPVLLSPATGVTPEQNFSWNYERSFDAGGVPWCAVTMPERTLGDIQVAAEYIVYAIRTMRAQSGRPIAVLGHSQGGMSMRWALRFWPDTRAKVDDVIGLAPTNHGTGSDEGACGGGCVPAAWQQLKTSAFIKAINSRAETFSGVSYTNVYTHTDEVAYPNADDSGTSSLHTGRGAVTNVATQDICPADTNEHVQLGTVDPVAYALAADALDHPGPAKPARIPQAVCSQPSHPGVDPLSAQTYEQQLAALPGTLAGAFPINVVGARTVRAEPALRCYVFASCPAGFQQATCLRLGGKVAGTHVGPVVVGRTRARVRSSLGPQHNRRTRPGLDRWCVEGGGIVEAGYPTRRLPLLVRKRLGGKVVLGLVSSRRFALAGVRPGSSTRFARKRLRGERGYRVGLNVWLVGHGRRSTLVVCTRGGHVRAVGLAARSATRSRRGTRRLLGAWKL